MTAVPIELPDEPGWSTISVGGIHVLVRATARRARGTRPRRCRARRPRRRARRADRRRRAGGARLRRRPGGCPRSAWSPGHRVCRRVRPRRARRAARHRARPVGRPGRRPTAPTVVVLHRASRPCPSPRSRPRTGPTGRLSSPGGGAGRQACRRACAVGGAARRPRRRPGARPPAPAPSPPCRRCRGYDYLFGATELDRPDPVPAQPRHRRTLPGARPIGRAPMEGPRRHPAPSTDQHAAAPQHTRPAARPRPRRRVGQPGGRHRGGRRSAPGRRGGSTARPRRTPPRRRAAAGPDVRPARRGCWPAPAPRLAPQQVPTPPQPCRVTHPAARAAGGAGPSGVPPRRRSVRPAGAAGRPRLPPSSRPVHSGSPAPAAARPHRSTPPRRRRTTPQAEEATVDRARLLTATGSVPRGPTSSRCCARPGTPARRTPAPAGSADREIPPQQPFQTPRPPLGLLRPRSGDVVSSTAASCSGARPRSTPTCRAADRPHLVRVVSPRTTSRATTSRSSSRAGTSWSATWARPTAPPSRCPASTRAAAPERPAGHRARHRRSRMADEVSFTYEVRRVSTSTPARASPAWSTSSRRLGRLRRRLPLRAADAADAGSRSRCSRARG